MVTNLTRFAGISAVFARCVADRAILIATMPDRPIHAASPRRNTMADGAPASGLPVARQKQAEPQKAAMHHGWDRQHALCHR